jgi:hypothetical protein
MVVARRLAIGVGALVAVALVAWLTGRPSPPDAVTLTGERCGTCHQAVVGIEAAHAAVGCAACHLGQPSATTAEAAHVDLVRIPGNVADARRTCGADGCHVDVPARIESSVMTTMNGVVSVDRWVFGEQAEPTGVTPVTALGHSPADSHLRNLCVSCHLGNEKAEPGPIDESSRGGGCLACHLRYSTEARVDVGHGLEKGFHHPSLTSRVDDSSCFGCHSRSGRISLNAAGWREGGPPGSGRRTLADGRVLTPIAGDVHVERGMSCTDCHGSWEVMGMGAPALHREAQAIVQCTDCHRLTPPETRSFDALDPESARLVARLGAEAKEREVVTTAKGGLPLVNVFLDQGEVFLEGKATGRVVPSQPPSPACSGAAPHQRLACGTCHDAWTPTCIGCHTRFDPGGTMLDLLTNQEAPGEWHEEGGEILAERASLGVRELADGSLRVEQFAPGMVMTLRPRPELPVRFLRLFAPVTPHTVQRASRTCEDCHASPVALGYGRGELLFEGSRWRFAPSRALRPEDGLPDDAWIGFLATRDGASTTRQDTRPFSVSEQRRILTVGACLTCHAAGSAVMQAARTDFRSALGRVTPKCRAPEWD